MVPFQSNIKMIKIIALKYYDYRDWSSLNTDTINFIKGNVTIFGLILKV